MLILSEGQKVSGSKVQGRRSKRVWGVGTEGQYVGLNCSET